MNDDLLVYFHDNRLKVKVGMYASNGATSLSFVGLDGEPYLTATTNLPESSGLTPFQFFLKDWSENAGVPQSLARYIHKVGSGVRSGYVTVQCYEAREDSALYNLIDAGLGASLDAESRNVLTEVTSNATGATRSASVLGLKPSATDGSNEPEVPSDPVPEPLSTPDPGADVTALAEKVYPSSDADNLVVKPKDS
jgi:hypothetical protein